MMKRDPSLLLSIIFFLIGIGMLIGGIFAYRSNQQFLQSSLKSKGTVTSLDLRHSSDSSSYHPVVQFRTLKNQIINFTSSVGSNPASYQVGETVEVNYDPTNPNSAKINDFSSNWLTVLILSVMGTVFSSLGLILPVNTIRLSRKKKWLLENGKRISSEFQKIETNTSFEVNGRHPYMIVSQWHDVETQTIHIFESENIWYNPEKFVNNKTIDVLVDSKNYKRYYMDINFLPKTEL
jgi:hypothetical protein